MKKRNGFLFGVILILLFLIAGCGQPEVGINELSVIELKKKLDSHETFLLLTFAADKKDVKKVKLIESVDDSLRRAGLTGFYVNLEGADKAIEQLEKEYTHPKASSWDPLKEGLVLVENGGVTNIGGGSVAQEIIKQKIEKENPYASDYFDGIVKDILEYIQFYRIELSY